MRLPPRRAGLLALAAILASCSDQVMVAPSPEAAVAVRFDAHATAPEVRISEIHYDNDGADTGEAIEVSGPAGMDLTGWKLVQYNGSGGAVVTTTSLPTPVPPACGARGVVVVAAPGLQNGSPDGVALVDAAGDVVEFLSWEGLFVATAGPAAGMTSTDIGVSESGSTPIGHSLQRDPAGVWQAAQAATFGACNDGDGGGDPPPPPPPPTKAPASAITDTWVSELHYDDEGTDSGEAIEIEGPAGRSVEGWQVALYNQGAVYGAIRILSGVIPATCGDRGVVVLDYPSNGLQNGGQDGVALIDADGGVVQVLSYEGIFTAADGPALQWVSTDIGVAETGTTPDGQSLQRIGATWQEPRAATLGACNDSPAPPPPPVLPLVINELMAEPEAAPGGASWGEWFEVHNYGSEPIDLQGWTIASGGSNQPDHVIDESVLVPAGGYAVLGRGYDVERNGGVVLSYNYFAGPSTIWLDDEDWLVLRNAAGATVDSVAWTSVARGVTRALRGSLLHNVNVNGSAWGYSTTEFGNGDFGTPGAANGTLSDAPPAVRRVVINGRTSLPVGFQDVFGARYVDAEGATIPGTIILTSETPELASVEGRGVVTALAPGQAILRATAEDGTYGRYFLTTYAAAPSPTAQYQDHTEFGEPRDADASDDFIIRRDQYTLSYSGTRNTPNWVAYNLEATHFGGEDRCNCFSADPTLPAGFARILTTDYSGSGEHAGYGIDRGHMVRSADRGAGALDNAVTFYLTNVVPQTADQNQGPWAALEMYLADRAAGGSEEIYIITGVAGNIGTLKDEGKVVIPASVWKVAVVLPRDRGLDYVRGWQDLEVIAVVMPNVPGIRNVNWSEYRTTVDAIEAASGYDLLALLPDPIERVVESGTRPPQAVIDLPAAAFEGLTLSLSGAGSSDPDGEALAWDWQLGDGTTSPSAAPSHTYAQDGSYTLRLIVTDVYGLADTATATLAVANVVPVVSFGGTTLLPGETYRMTGSFTDSGADDWTADVDYGIGVGAQPLVLSGQSFLLSQTYGSAGAYTVTVRIADDDATGSGTAEVLVLTHAAAFGQLLEEVAALRRAGMLTSGNATSLASKLENGARQAANGQTGAAANLLRAFVQELRALEDAGRIPAAAAVSLSEWSLRLQASLGR